MISVGHLGIIYIISGAKDEDIFNYCPLENGMYLAIDPSQVPFSSWCLTSCWDKGVWGC